MIIRTKSFNTLKNTYYGGEHTNFSFKKYTNKHMSTYKDLQAIGHPTPGGLDERTKIQYFKDGIKPSANLEMALSVASQNPIYEDNFVSMVNYIGSKVDQKLGLSQIRIIIVDLSMHYMEVEEVEAAAVAEVEAVEITTLMEVKENMSTASGLPASTTQTFGN